MSILNIPFLIICLAISGLHFIKECESETKSNRVLKSSYCRAKCTNKSANKKVKEVPEENAPDSKRITEYVLRNNILGMKKEKIEEELDFPGELSTSGSYTYPMIYDALLTIYYKNERAVEVQIVGEAMWEHR